MFKGEERFITIPGFTLALREWGPPDGIPTLALHGWLDNASTFSTLAPLLPGLHIFAVDSPGCGHSSHRAPGAISYVIDEVFYMLQVATALGLDKFSLIGHSRGGAVSQLIAASCPQRIQSLVLLDVVGLFSATPHESLEHLRESVQNFFALNLKGATLFPTLESAAKDRMNDSSLSFDSALLLTERGTKKVEGGFVWTIDRRELFFTSPVRYTEEMVKGFLSGIEAPTCIVIAEEGLCNHYSRDVANAKCIKRSAVHYVPGGHFVHMNNPEIVADILNEFYKKLNHPK